MSKHNNVCVLHREHGIAALGVKLILRRCPEMYSSRSAAHRTLGPREGRVMQCDEIHTMDQLLEDMPMAAQPADAGGVAC